MALPPDDRRLAAYLVESATLPLESLLPAIEEASSTGDLGTSLVRRSLLGASEVERLRAEAESHRPSEWQRRLEAGVGATLRSDLNGIRRTPRVIGGLTTLDTPAAPDSDAPLGDDTPRDSQVSSSETTAHGGGSGPRTVAERATTRELYLEPEMATARHFLPELSKSEPPVAEERYLLLGEIGRGGMGRILRARDRLIGREVAVKVMIEGTRLSDLDLRRFWMEVQATGQLEHPAIIPVHDVGRLPSGELFYVMKLLTGRTLADVLTALRRGNPEVSEELPRTRLLTLYQQVAYAMAYAHARGVIHRDLKPANIMIGRYGEVTILDWGLAKLLRATSLPAPVEEEADREARARSFARTPPTSGSETAEGTVTGTPQYMAPEAVEGHPEKVGEKADVYGLGAVLYEILTLEPAFADRGFLKTLVDVRAGSFVPPRLRAPDRGISRELEDLCLRAMSMDPEDRPTAKELADDLGTILEGTKERERRIAEARARVREGRAALDRWRILKEELGDLEQRVHGLAKLVPPWAPAVEKTPLWDLADRASRLRIEAIGAFEEAEAGFLRALGELPEDREARALLATLYYDRFSEAEKTHDVEGQRYYRSLVARYDDGAWAKVLAGRGSLSVTASLPGMEVRLARLMPNNRVLRPTDERSLGLAPVTSAELPIGSYIVTLVAPGRRPIVRPVLIGRMEDVRADVTVYPDEAIGEDLVYVPAGPAILGGDPVAHGARERRVVDVPDFAVARYPVTCAEYLAFVNALGQQDPVAALRRVPRALPSGGHYWTWDASRGEFSVPPGSWEPRFPIVSVSFEDAQAYIAWRAARTGERLRLPREEEWEKAARGVDGRFFPWGDHFDASFCKMKDSRQTPSPEREPVGAFSTDRSPYGAHDFAGGVRELCVSTEHEPVMRGGCWHDTGLFCRLAFRHVTKPDFVNTGLGFRLVRELG
jgi:serine/threonine protein kinase/formylglycine-generating enzyme required for sulfatase activity